MKKANILKIASAFVLVAAMLIFCACGKDLKKRAEPAFTSAEVRHAS